MDTFDFSIFNSYVLKKDNLKFTLIFSNKCEQLLYCNYLEQTMSFQKAGTDVIPSSLDAIIILRRGNNDYIETISQKQQLALLISECALDIENRKLIHSNLEQLSDLIQQVPIFVLHYTTPEKSIKLLYDYLDI